MENILRTPWKIEETYRGLYDVYDCDGNFVVRQKVKEVAQLIAEALELRRRLQELGERQEQQIADPQYYNLEDWAPTADLEAIEEDDDDPGESFLDYGRPGAGDVDPWQEGAIEDELSYEEDGLG